MRKLFFPLLFSSILFFLSGCQTETPVSPTTQDNTLAKGRSINFTGTVQSSGDGFVQVNLEWSGLKNVAYYRVFYYNRLSGTQTGADQWPGSTTSFEATYAMLQQSGDTCTITVNAYKLRKGNPVLMASGTQNFTYSGTSLTIIPLSGGLNQNGDYATLSYSFTGIGAANYSDAMFRSWTGTITTHPSTGTNTSSSVIHTLSAGDFVTLTVYAYDGTGNVIGIGNRKYIYP